MYRFGTVLAQELVRQDLTGRDFARRVGCSQAYLSKILRGQRPPPMGQILDWMEALGLDAHTQRQLVILACLDHAPPLMTDVVLVLTRLALTGPCGSLTPMEQIGAVLHHIPLTVTPEKLRRRTVDKG